MIKMLQILRWPTLDVVLRTNWTCMSGGKPAASKLKRLCIVNFRHRADGDVSGTRPFCDGDS